ncbi:MAG: TolC family outer membrane protein [Caulobacteraceae bacterium]
MTTRFVASRVARLFSFVAVLALPALSNARAETLADAIALAYQSNPTLQSQRALQRALDETYVQSRAGWRPTATAQGTANWSRTDLGREYGGQTVTVPTGTGEYTSTSATSYQENYGTGGISATQPLYSGGKVGAAVKAAEATVLAGRENLRLIESQILQNVITAYEDTRRDAQILKIRDDNTGVLRSQLEETQAKFDVGQVTRTDVAQAQAQLAQAQALLATAKAQLQISRANYAAVVGQNPGDLAPEPALPGLPGLVDQAFDAADANNPTLRQAQITEQASRARIVEAKAANRPTLSAQATIGYDGTLVPFGVTDYDRAITGELIFTQPLFTGGVNSSLIRQAIEQNNSDRIAIETARRSVVQTVSQAWNTMVGDKASVTSNLEQVRAAEVAFEGIREQYRVGLSSTLDVLIQQQTLETAQLSLVQAQHDAYVAESNLLAAMGRLEVADLVSGVPLYDPATSFNKVKNAGAVPWEPLIAALDSVGAPHVGEPKPISAPPPPGAAVVMIPADQPVPTNARLSTEQPTAPAPNTTAPSTPPTLGAKPGAAAPITPPPAPPVKVDSAAPNVPASSTAVPPPSDQPHA